jgi:predicted nucleic acid-binding protein
VAGIVLTDASPLIGLARVNGLGWLENLFIEVWLPVEVRREVLSGLGSADEQAILQEERRGVLKVWPEEAPHGPELPDLDEGEAACIRIALTQVDRSLVLMDERAGRVLAAEAGLKVIGTAAIIGLAKTRGLIPSAKQVFEKLHASDFRISADVIRTVLRRVNE